MADQKKKKKGIFDDRNDQLDDIYNWQNNDNSQVGTEGNDGTNPNDEAEEEYPNLKKKGKKRGFFG